MDSPFGPFLANAFLSYHEENWLNKMSGRIQANFFTEVISMVF